MNSGELYASCEASLASDPIQPTAAGLFQFKGRIIDWLVGLGPDALKLIPLDTVVATVEQVFDATVGAFNFPQIPDIFETPIKAYVRSQIRPLVAQIYAGLTGGS